MTLDLEMNTYWENRYLNQSLKAFNSSEDYVRWLRNQYEATLNSINEDIYSHLSKIAKDNQVTLVDAKKYLNKNELKAFKWKLSKFKDAAKKGGYDKELNTIYHRQRISRLQAMEYEMNLHLYKLMDEEERQLFRKLGQNYKATYQDELNNLNDIFSKNHLYRLNEKALDKVINTPWSPDGNNFSARIWERRDKLADVLKTNIVQGIIRGDSIDKIAKNIEKSMGAGLNNAKRLARTEINAIHAKARADVFKDYDVDKVEICAKLDGRTSDICRGLDGKVIALKDVKSGITGPPFHPNCRTVLIPYIDDEIQKEIEESANNKNEIVTEEVEDDIIKLESWDTLIKNAKNFENIEDADEFFRPQTCDYWTKWTQDEKSAIYSYTGNSDPFNQPLKGFESGWREENYIGIENVTPIDRVKNIIKNITTALDKTELTDDVIVYRGSGNTSLAALLQIDKSELKDINNIKDKIVNKVVTEKGFLSTSVNSEFTFNSNNVQYKIFCPKGTKGAYVEPFSAYGASFDGLKWDGRSIGQLENSSENEFLIQRDTKFRIKDIFIDENDILERIQVLLEVVLDV